MARLLFCPQMTPRFSIVISTADRSPSRNYLIDTLNGLKESGVFSDPRRYRLGIVDTGKGVLQRTRAAVWCMTSNVPVAIIDPERKRSSPDNASAGLEWAAWQGSEWTIFLEDDVEVCGRFLESVELWLAENATRDVPLCPLCANYGKKEGRDRNDKTWLYLIGRFYGTQGFAIWTSEAGPLSKFLKDEAQKRGWHNGLDLLIKDWLAAEFPDVTHLVAPGMDFVQHVGKESAIHPGRFHQYPHFGGTGWSYGARDKTYYDPEELKRSQFSPALAKLLCSTLDPSVPVYDFGCGLGRYVAKLEAAGFVALGIEGHPQARSVTATPNVISWDLSEPLPDQLRGMPRGSVVSIEVGEHIPADKCGTFLSNLDALCQKTLILTWAVRGQGGRCHINELDAGELVPLLLARDYRFDVEKTNQWREAAGADLHWFKRSIYCFERV